jgi:hypothetical protein
MLLSPRNIGDSRSVIRLEPVDLARLGRPGGRIERQRALVGKGDDQGVAVGARNTSTITEAPFSELGIDCGSDWLAMEPDLFGGKGRRDRLGAVSPSDTPRAECA